METTSTHSPRASSASQDLIASSETQNLPEPNPQENNENYDEIERPRGPLRTAIRDAIYAFVDGFSSAKKKKQTTEKIEAVPMQCLSPPHTVTIEPINSATKEEGENIQIEDVQAQPELIKEDIFPQEANNEETPAVTIEEKIEIFPAANVVSEDLPSIATAIVENNDKKEEVPQNNEIVTTTTMEIITTETNVIVEPSSIPTEDQEVPLAPQNSKVEEAPTDALVLVKDDTAMEIQDIQTVVPSDENIQITVEKTTVVTVTYEVEQPLTGEFEKSDKEEITAHESPKEYLVSSPKSEDKMVEEQPKLVTPIQTATKSLEVSNPSSERVRSLFRDTVASASKRAESSQKSDATSKSQKGTVQMPQPRNLNLNQSIKQRSESLTSKAAAKPEQVHKIQLKPQKPNHSILQPKNTDETINQKKRKADAAQVGGGETGQLKKTKMNDFDLMNKGKEKTLPGNPFHLELILIVYLGPTLLKENNPNDAGAKKVVTGVKPKCVYCGQSFGDNKKDVQMLSCTHKAHTV